MNKELLLNFIGMTEDQVIHEFDKINLNYDELEVFNKGNDFIDKYEKLENGDFKRRVILKILGYQLIKKNGGK